MIVLDSSSECDVCFEPYDLEGNAETWPHGIPCGHIFCKSCLDGLSVCPLCREPFTPDHAAKLHAEPARNSQSPIQQTTEVVFLRRLIQASYNSHGSEKLEDVLEEAFVWLDSQPSDSNELLRSAWITFSTRQGQDKPDQGECSLELYEQLDEAERTYREAQEEWEMKVATAEAETSSLRLENSELRRTCDRNGVERVFIEAEAQLLRSENDKLRLEYEQKVASLNAEISRLNTANTRLHNPSSSVSNNAPQVSAGLPSNRSKLRNSQRKSDSSNTVNMNELRRAITVHLGDRAIPEGKAKATSTKIAEPVNKLLGGVQDEPPDHVLISKSIDAAENPTSLTGLCAIALCDFQDEEDGYLSLKAGEIVQQIDKTGGDWWSGVKRDGSRHGLFPACYVEIVTRPKALPRDPDNSESSSQAQSRTNKGKRAVALYDFQGAGDGFMSLEQGEVIENICDKAGGWCSGTGQDGSKNGLFPADYMQAIEDLPVTSPPVSPEKLDTKSTSQPPPVPRTGVHARVLYAYEPLDSGDMRLVEGEIIEQVDQLSDVWWSGVGDEGSKFGLFPANHVEIIDSFDGLTGSLPTNNIISVV